MNRLSLTLHFKRIIVAAFLVVLYGVTTAQDAAHAAPLVTCTGTPATSPSGGGTTPVYVSCVITGVNTGDKIRNSGQNILSPSAVTITSGANTLTANLSSSAPTSPDGSVTSISGSGGGGFTGTISAVPATIRFQYDVVTTGATPAGLYASASGAVSYAWRITPPSGPASGSGTATASLSLTVPTTPTTLSCSSTSVTTPSGGGSFTVNVDCVASGGGSAFSPSGSNTFSPATAVFTNGGDTVNASLQSSVTSPNATVTSITGSSTGGFTGTITSLPATVRVQYTGTTTSTTKAGTYTSGNVTYTWAAL